MHLDFPPDSCSYSLRIRHATILKPVSEEIFLIIIILCPVSALITVVTEIAVTVLTQTFSHIFGEELGNFPR